MKGKITLIGIIMLASLFLAIPVYSVTETCYQEQANSDPNGCGGATGSYSTTSNYIYMTYGKPAGAIGATWQVKHGSLSTYNISLPSECFTASSSLELRIYSSFYGYTTTSESQPQCKDSTGNWISVGTFSSATGTGYGTTSDSVTNGYDSNYETGIMWGKVGNIFERCTVGYCNAAMIYEEGIFWDLNVTQCTSGSCCDTTTNEFLAEGTKCYLQNLKWCEESTPFYVHFDQDFSYCTGTSNTCPTSPTWSSVGTFECEAGSVCDNGACLSVGECTSTFDCNVRTEQCINYQCTELPATNVELSIDESVLYEQAEVSGDVNISLDDMLNEKLESCVADSEGFCTFDLRYEWTRPGDLTLFEPIVPYFFNDLSFCQDGIDNDNDGYVDSEDPDCLNGSRENNWDPGNTQCSDGTDNDGDGHIDLADSSCESLQDNSETEGFVSYQMSLISGDNFVSFPILPTDKTVETVFGDEISKITSIKTINNGTLKEWSSNIKSIDSLSEGVGYAIETTDIIDLNITGLAKKCVLDITKGYNYVGVIGFNSISSDIFVNQTLYNVESEELVPITTPQIFSSTDAFIVQSDYNTQIICD